MNKTPEQQRVYDEWLASRPQVIKDMVAKYPGDRLYRLNDTQIVYITAYNEDGTVLVGVSREFNIIILEREVFGINPETLVPIDADVDTLRLNWTDEDMALFNEAEERLNAEIDEWHKEIPAELTGRARAEIVIGKCNSYTDEFMRKFQTRKSGGAN